MTLFKYRLASTIRIMLAVVLLALLFHWLES